MQRRAQWRTGNSSRCTEWCIFGNDEPSACPMNGAKKEERKDKVGRRRRRRKEKRQREAAVAKRYEKKDSG